jgi:hypothetical protein
MPFRYCTSLGCSQTATANRPANTRTSTALREYIIERRVLADLRLQFARLPMGRNPARMQYGDIRAQSAGPMKSTAACIRVRRPVRGTAYSRADSNRFSLPVKAPSAPMPRGAHRIDT